MWSVMLFVFFFDGSVSVTSLTMGELGLPDTEVACHASIAKAKADLVGQQKKKTIENYKMVCVRKFGRST